VVELLSFVLLFLFFFLGSVGFVCLVFFFVGGGG